MVRKPDIQYIRYYTDGSAARALRLLPAAPKTKLPKLKRQKALVISLDPLAYAGILVSLVMLVLMVVSCIQLAGIQQRTDVMNSYVDTLKEKNARLDDTYHSGYDLKDVEQKALAMGMVPIEEVLHITVAVDATREAEESVTPLWAFLTDISE